MQAGPQKRPFHTACERYCFAQPLLPFKAWVDPANKYMFYGFAKNYEVFVAKKFTTK
jgi:hypothetical protein